MLAANQNRLRILLTEDHVSTRLGVKQILRNAFVHIEIGEASDAAETIALLNQSQWDLLVLDIGLPDRHGFDLLRLIKQKMSALPVLIYSVHPEDQFAVHALKAGAAGYLAKDRSPEELCAAVRSILSTGHYFNSSLMLTHTESESALAEDMPHKELSAREFQVLLLIVAGKSGKAIAAELALSQKTVSTYRTRILRKLQLATLADLMQYAIRTGLM